MPALNFKKEFAAAVERGEKRQTIRAPRRDGRPSATIGARLMLYTGMRTKSCRKLMDAVCTNTSQIVITSNPYRIIVNGVEVDDDEAFARADGFDNVMDFYDFFDTTHGLPFEGALIEWIPASRG